MNVSRILLPLGTFAAGALLTPFLPVRPAAGPAPSPATLTGNAGIAAPGIRLPAMGRAEALTDALRLLDPAGRSHSLTTLGRDYAATDPAAAWQLYPGIAGATDRQDYCLGVLGPWAAQDLPAALSAAQALPPGRLRTACLSATLRQMALTDPAAASTLAAGSLTGAARDSALASTLEAWGSQDPAAAVAWALQQSSSSATTTAITAAVAGWADTDPGAAGQWVAALPPGPVRSGAAGSLTSRWAEQAPAEAAAWITAQGVDRDLDAPAAALAAQWAARDPRHAMDWALTLPRTMTARDAASRAMGEWAAVDPVSAAAWLAGNSTAIPDFTSALHDSLATGWAAHDPAGAATWLEALTDPWLRTGSAPEVFNTWANTAPETLTDWLDPHTSSPVFSEALTQLALTRSGDDPAGAMTIALSLPDDAAATRLGRRLYEDWESRDPASALRWLQGNPQLFPATP